MRTVLLFAAGDPLPYHMLEELPRPDLVVAADGGFDSAIDLGYRVDVLVGDLDSLQEQSIPRHVVVERHPADKDATDLELALELVSRQGPERVVVVGASGGRLDHELATAALLCSERWDSIDELDWISARGFSYVVRGRRIIHGDPGALVTLLPMGDQVEGVHTKGLKWDLAGDTLPYGTSRGVSNVMRGPVADIRVEQGCLLVVVPLSAEPV